MLDEIDLSGKLEKGEYKKQKDELGVKLGVLQRRVVEHRIPVVILFEGWDAAGKGRLINRLILPLDPRGFNVYTTLKPTEEEALRPFLWRFWIRTPAGGRFAIFDRSWYRRVLSDRVDGETGKEEAREAVRDIVATERQLSDSGALIIKFFLHISKKEQRKRFKRLESDPTTSWRVTKADWRRHRSYKQYLHVTEAMLASSESSISPWTIIEAEDHRFATVKMLQTVVSRLQEAVAAADAHRRSPVSATRADAPGVSILSRARLDRSLDPAAYQRGLRRRQDTLRELHHRLYMERIPVVIVYEGWDAAGKGGNIRRLTENLDPRGYSVVPIAAPNDIEAAHHYLWRFWTGFPKGGHIAIFDRSWYGRVMVERVEGFCSAEEWRRAYREINEMERHWTSSGTVVLKFWLQIDKAEQLRRFRAREHSDYKRWKITDEDWRNRKKWSKYEAAVEEMLARTSPPTARWTVVESNCKRYARIKVMDTVIRALKRRLPN